MANLNEKFLKKIFINKYIKCYRTLENLEGISTYLYFMLSKIQCIDFSSCFVSFMFDKFKFIKNNISDKETNLFNLIMDHIMVNDRNTSLSTINMLIISCLLKQHYRYAVSYLIPNIRTKINPDHMLVSTIEDGTNAESFTINNSNSEEIITDDYIKNSLNEIKNKENVSENKKLTLKDEVYRYIELYNNIKTDFGSEAAGINNQCKEYIFDVNTNSNIQLSGLNFNNLNKDYPENIIQNIADEPCQIKAIKLLDQEKIFSQLFILLKSFFVNSPDFNLALTDAISQLLCAPEIYIFIYLVNRDILEDDNKDSLYTIFTYLINQRKELLNDYQNELLKLNSLDNDSLYQKQHQILISDFNRNSRFLLEFIKEVTTAIFEIQLKSEIFENY